MHQTRAKNYSNGAILVPDGGGEAALESLLTFSGIRFWIQGLICTPWKTGQAPVLYWARLGCHRLEKWVTVQTNLGRKWYGSKSRDGPPGQTVPRQDFGTQKRDVTRYTWRRRISYPEKADFSWWFARHIYPPAQMEATWGCLYVSITLTLDFLRRIATKKSSDNSKKKNARGTSGGAPVSVVAVLPLI